MGRSSSIAGINAGLEEKFRENTIACRRSDFDCLHECSGTAGGSHSGRAAPAQSGTGADEFDSPECA